jgi:hypothetical protein
VGRLKIHKERFHFTISQNTKPNFQAGTKQISQTKQNAHNTEDNVNSFEILELLAKM